MRSSLSHETLPIFSLEIEKGETRYRTVEQIIDHFSRCIDDDPLACFIGVFDHHAHTTALHEGWVDPSILAAQSVVFCFGLTLPGPRVTALRPRSIGVCELPGCFVISFAEPPMPVANLAMERWAEAIAQG